MGPIGFIVGPVVVTLFVVLLEIYNQYIGREDDSVQIEAEHD
jgi:predicted PurR-regulated permease PerM